MHKKRILIITHGFYPEQSPRSFRATELVKELCRQGHEVTVWAPEREGTKRLQDEYSFRYVSLGELKWKLFNFKSLGLIGRLYNKVVNRFVPLLFEFPAMEIYFKIRKQFKKEKERYDMLISIAVPYPIHWGVASQWNTNKNKNIADLWAADCGDPYCFQENDTFRPPFYFRFVEKWFMRKTDFIVVPTENSHQGYFPEFHSKMKVIPQGFRFEDIDKQHKIQDGVVRFGYGGAFILDRRDPRELLDFLCNLPPDISFEFHVYTNHEHFILPYANKDKRIVLHKPIDRISLLQKFSSFDFVINFANIGNSQTPSKLIDYAIIDKPILEITTNNLDSEKVQNFLNGDFSSATVIHNPEKYRIENVVLDFLTLLTA